MDQKNNSTMSIYEALSRISSSASIHKILRDLCTPKEIQNIEERWTICQLLHQNYSYREIHRSCGSSLTTITRVARFLTVEKNQGYKLLLNLMETQS